VTGSEAIGRDREGDAVRIETILGGIVTVKLWEDRTRGELWVPSYPAAGLALLEDEFVRTASNNAVETGMRTFQFRALATGRHQIVYEKRMGWKFTAEDRRVYVIDVSESRAEAGRS
jgi:predicted secreted protein